MEGKQVWWKWLILAMALLFSMVVVWPPAEKIRLGLDLQGGSSFTVQIDQDRLRSDLRIREPELTAQELDVRVREVLRDADERALEVLRNRINALGIEEPVITAGRDHRIQVQLPGISDEQRDMAEQSVRSAAFLEFRLAHRDNRRLTEELFDRGVAPEGYRIEPVGGLRYYRRTEAYDKLSREADYAERLAMFEVPDPAFEFMLEKRVLESGAEVYRPHFVRRRSELTGDRLRRAEVVFGTFGASEVSLSFDAEGAQEFARVTSYYAPNGQRNRGNERGYQLAVVLDGTLYSAPEIEERIPGGRAVIRGQFSPTEAAVLRNALNAGALPAPVKIIEKSFVSPTLGRQAVRSGLTAMVVGGLGVMIFMLIYYAYCGLIANVALMLNMLLLPAGMILAAGMLGVFLPASGVGGGVRLPVMTLPGIAGILLAIGMAVDANVLIFERIREEMSEGKRLRGAILAAYDRAYITIVDANVTTLLVGLILFLFGSGPIRGFAITLSAGIMVSMFTALVATKLFFMATVSDTRTGRYRMLSIIRKNTAIDFVGMKRAALLFSTVMILGAWAVFGIRVTHSPSSVLAVDFTGGRTISFSFAERAQVDVVREALDTLDLVSAPQVQYKDDMDGDSGLLNVTVGVGDLESERLSERMAEVLNERMAEGEYRFQAEEEVGAQVGSELRRSAFWAILFALLGIIVYITLRFEFGFSLGAIAALAHDVLITAGIFSLLGRPISLAIVAALLTIVGYSVNDTIVVFDRIREDLRLDPKRAFPDICNLSINQTLSRTVLTSLTTLLAMLALFVFGGGAINDFALAMMIGIVAGTYSTVFIATPVTLAWYGGRRPDFAAKG